MSGRYSLGRGEYSSMQKRPHIVEGLGEPEVVIQKQFKSALMGMWHFSVWEVKFWCDVGSLTQVTFSVVMLPFLKEQAVSLQLSKRVHEDGCAHPLWWTVRARRSLSAGKAATSAAFLRLGAVHLVSIAVRIKNPLDAHSMKVNKVNIRQCVHFNAKFITKILITMCMLY